MRVAIVHDDLVQWGGAERVLLSLHQLSSLSLSLFCSHILCFLSFFLYFFEIFQLKTWAKLLSRSLSRSSETTRKR